MQLLSYLPSSQQHLMIHVQPNFHITNLQLYSSWLPTALTNTAFIYFSLTSPFQTVLLTNSIYFISSILCRNLRTISFQTLTNTTYPLLMCLLVTYSPIFLTLMHLLMSFYCSSWIIWKFAYLISSYDR